MQPRRHATSGFTLVELMITVAIIGVLIGIAVPNLTSSRVLANERTIVATMRQVVVAQAQARIGNTVDQDRDGVGEAANLPELAGATALRGSGELLRPAVLSTLLGTLDADGFANSGGYCFALYLPDAAGDGVIATDANLPSVDTDLSESYWTCLAWPRDRRTRGKTTYFANQVGEILMTRGGSYSGRTSVPPAGAALSGVPPTTIATDRLAAGTTGADGLVWHVAR